MAKDDPKFIASCCGKPIEDCPGCPQGTIIKKTNRDKTMEEHLIFQKIEEGTVTVDDFNKLISEATPEALRDRVRRRTTQNATDGHIDDEGHQKLDLPKFADRVQPKREKADNTQMHGRGKIAHKKSARTQKRKAVHESRDVTNWYNNYDNIKLVARYLVEVEDWAASDLLHFIDKPRKWGEKYEQARTWANEQRTRR